MSARRLATRHGTKMQGSMEKGTADTAEKNSLDVVSRLMIQSVSDEDPMSASLVHKTDLASFPGSPPL